MQNIKKVNLNNIITKILISTKLPNSIRETGVSKLVFTKIPCHKVWALGYYASSYKIFSGKTHYKCSRRHLRNSFNVFFIYGFTV